METEWKIARISHQIEGMAIPIASLELWMGIGPIILIQPKSEAFVARFRMEMEDRTKRSGNKFGIKEGKPASLNPTSVEKRVSLCTGVECWLVHNAGRNNILPGQKTIDIDEKTYQGH